MKTSFKNKLQTLSDRYQDIGKEMSDPKTMRDQNRFRDLGKEYAQLEPVHQCFEKYLQTEKAIDEANALLQEEKDLELKSLVEEEIQTLNQQLGALEQQLKTLLIPQDPNDERNVFLEIRAGAGGGEASIFAGDLFRMYSRYCERKNWTLSIISEHASEQGGFKEIIARITGEKVYSQLKFESGAHRVQRVPVTESQGRIHTSTCTIAVLPEADEIEPIEINPAELRIDTYRASGAGGQHVNKTDSAIRITHLPTGIVVECQDERSQHKNRARAMSLLKSRLLTQERVKQEKEQAETRRGLVGTGDRSERIRTYNYPQRRITDHRINLTIYNLEAVMEGDLDVIIEPLSRELQAELLAELGES